MLARPSSSCIRSLTVLTPFFRPVGASLAILSASTSLMGTGSFISSPALLIILTGDASLCPARLTASYSTRSCIGKSQGSYPKVLPFLPNSTGTCCRKGYWIG